MVSLAFKFFYASRKEPVLSRGWEWYLDVSVWRRATAPTWKWRYGSLPTHQNTKLYLRLEKKLHEFFPALVSRKVSAHCFGHFTSKKGVRVKYGRVSSEPKKWIVRLQEIKPGPSAHKQSLYSLSNSGVYDPEKLFLYPPIKFVSHSTSNESMGSYTAETEMHVVVKSAVSLDF